MGLLDQVIASGGGHALNLCPSVKHGEFPDRRPISPELVRVDGHWDVVFPQQMDKKEVGGFRVTVRCPCNRTLRTAPDPSTAHPSQC